ncbi:type II toxin-antitoxin system VapC family toxin [Candidatus Margulisiibacteriota bacterium]
MKYLLDTHTWIWINLHPEKLTKKIRSLLINNSNYEELLISAISIWEFCKLLEKKRLVISCDPEEWIHKALEIPKLRFVNITPLISYKSTSLPRPFHEDPADQIIVATAREENATIITKDKLISEYEYVRSIW